MAENRPLGKGMVQGDSSQTKGASDPIDAPHFVNPRNDHDHRMTVKWGNDREPKKTTAGGAWEMSGSPPLRIQARKWVSEAVVGDGMIHCDMWARVLVGEPFDDDDGQARVEWMEESQSAKAERRLGADIFWGQQPIAHHSHHSRKEDNGFQTILAEETVNDLVLHDAWVHAYSVILDEDGHDEVRTTVHGVVAVVAVAVEMRSWVASGRVVELVESEKNLGENPLAPAPWEHCCLPTWTSRRCFHQSLWPSWHDCMPRECHPSNCWC